MSDDMLLKGVRVLELGTTIAGPFCGRLLGDAPLNIHHHACRDRSKYGQEYQ